jgi:predicted O-linked N-acetylglucosamine transferase (SPINDLY family)
MRLFSRFKKASRVSPGDGVHGESDADSRAVQLLDQGMEFEQRGEFDAALRHYDAALELRPGLARAHFQRGQVLQAQGSSAMALEAYDQALRLKPDSAAAHYNRGHTLFDLTRKEEALAAFRQAADLNPGFVDALVSVGMVLSDLDRAEEAARYYRRALQLKPDYVEVYFDLGSVLAQLGQLEELVQLYQRALQYKPDMAELHGNLANAMHGLKQFDAAISSYRIVLDARPEDAKAHNNLGNVLKDVGRLDEAQDCYRKAISLQPEFAVSHYNLAVVLQLAGALDQAFASYGRALSIDANYVEALVGQGEVQLDLGEYVGAQASCERALELRPGYAYAYIVLGNIQQSMGRRADALAWYERALRIDPDYAQGHNNVAAIWAELGHLDKAIASYRRALELEPGNSDALMNMGIALADNCQFDEAMASMDRALEIKPRSPVALSNLLFTYNYLATPQRTSMLSHAKRYGAMVSEGVLPYSSWSCTPEPRRPLRIGLVSADLRNHPVGYFIEGVLAAMASGAPGELQIFVYPTRAFDDETSRRIRSHCHGWHLAAGHSDEQLAQRIFADKIDVLIDLSGHTAHNRLPVFAWKPAPVQLSWLGYFATTGVEAIDYLVADPLTLPESEEAQFTEQIWRLPQTRLCFTPPNVQIDVAPLPASANGFVTFGCFNKQAKINDAVVALWARVLAAVPNSRLFLMSAPLTHASMRVRMAERFFVHGIGAERLILEGSVPRAEYLSAYGRIDIALDPFPFTGGTTTAEALWMGVPVLTLAGECFLARQGMGLLMNAGLPDWIAANPDDYVRRATSHANDLDRLSVLRATLREQVLASPLFDATRFAVHFSTALRGMWEKWCAAQAKN